MRITIGILLSLSLATVAHAEPKKLECRNNGEIVEWAAKHASFWTRMCKEYGDEGDCGNAKKADEEVKRCLSTGQDYSHTHYRTFDSDYLINAKGESWVKPCWTGETLFEDVEITSTFSTISFKGESESVFNVDRKTLRAGWGDDRKFRCTLSDLDTSENKL
jgi:hypothetical protein